ncbi:MAG: hypothetical protein HYX92_01965 [Chloroflexi bacterium]|nr:hypothetical protein [Chloroflexota bacterium]
MSNQQSRITGRLRQFGFGCAESGGGNITRFDDGAGGIHDYAYDDLDRLLTRRTLGAVQETFAYNQIGNITSSLTGGAYTYDQPRNMP